MCGICGVYQHRPEGRIDPSRIERMKALMRHRGPNENGTHIEEQVGLGHCRLSIIGLSSGRQPLSNETGSIWVSFNGEIYNYRPIRDRLVASGHQFSTETDTEVLVHLYEERGIDFVDELRGMFAIAIWDRDRRKLILARDRLGKKPLYYHDDGKRIVFASELKAVLSCADVPREPDLESIHHYLSLAYVPAPRTAFQGIQSLPAAHVLEASDGRVEVRRYWDIPHAEEDPGSTSLEESLEALDEKFDDSVRIRLESEVPLGVFLSGGVDSSAVAQRMARHLDRQLISTTIRFEDPRYDESANAAELAALLDCDHRVRDVGPGSTADLERILWHFDEPFADPSALPTYFLCKAARESLTVALSGDGGDELFAGYNRYAQLARDEALRARLPRFFRSLVRPFARLWPKHARGKTLLENLGRDAAASAAASFVTFDHVDKTQLYSDRMQAYLVDTMRTEAYYESLFASAGTSDPISSAQFADYRSYLVDDILVKVDRMSMAHSLEVRSPLLDHELVELVARLPSGVKLRDGKGKYIFKKMLERHLPSDVLYRPKQGFSVPLTGWFRGELKELLEDTIFGGSLARRGYFQQNYLERLWRRQQTGGRRVVDLGFHFWNLLLLELWHRKYIDSSDFARESAPTPRDEEKASVKS